MSNAEAYEVYLRHKLAEDGIFDALEKLGMVEKEKKYPQLDVVKAEGPVAHIKTNHGVLNVKLFPEIAPRTVANFVALSKDGYYDGIIAEGLGKGSGRRGV